MKIKSAITLHLLDRQKAEAGQQRRLVGCGAMNTLKLEVRAEAVDLESRLGWMGEVKEISTL